MKSDAPIATRASPNPSQAPSDLTLLVLTGVASGQTVPVDRRIRVGKAADNDLVLPDDTVSRHHCEVERRAEGVFVKDLGSTSGTRIAGSKVTEALAPPGAILRFGEVEVVVRAAQKRADVLPSAEPRFGPAIGESIAMRTVFGMLERIAPTDGTVLLEGETGTGKDVQARAIHLASPRAKQPFVVVDCGAISYSLIESELFGHEGGAFTGAIACAWAPSRTPAGALFLDEIGELPSTSTKLLRVLETRGFGASAATDAPRRGARGGRHQARSQTRGRTRKIPGGSYFRLAVVPIVVPPLRAARTSAGSCSSFSSKARRTTPPSARCRCRTAPCPR
jgi:transcriptional regulator of acetoin/glycerol metabolism